MKLELFSVPMFIGNIDLKKIKLTAEMGQAFLSETPSSYDNKNTLDRESGKYLISIVVELLQEKYQHFTVNLKSIWRNKYLNNDFQEPHVHTNSTFSFIIYEEVNTPYTIFYNPAKYLIEATQGKDVAVAIDGWCKHFKPQVKKGQIIVFPSYIEHMVNRNSEQVTISGNIDFKFNQSLTKGF
jgi:hypothetical protein